MPKKECAFMVFVNDWMNRQPRKMKIQDAVVEAGKVWEGMSEEMRQPYKEKKNGNGGHFKENRKENRSEPEHQPQNSRSAKNAQDERRLIKYIVKDSVKNDKITSQRYVFIMQDSLQNGVKPTEIALIGYSYEEGIAFTYHARLAPGDAEINRDQNVNQGQFAGILANPEKTLCEVYTEILNFVHSVDNNKCFFVYTKRDDIALVQGAVDSLRDKNPKAECLRVLPVEYLCFQIKEALCIKNQLNQPMFYEIENLFDSEAKETKAEQTACFYHKFTNNAQSCVLPKLKRWGSIVTQWLKGATVSGGSAEMDDETI